MPFRPFPLPYQIGTDICHIPRIRALITKPARIVPQKQLVVNGVILNQGFLKRLFTPAERELFHDRLRQSKFSNIDQVVQHLAGRWAAKEAVIKATTKKVGFHGIVIFDNQRGKLHAAILDDVPFRGRTIPRRVRFNNANSLPTNPNQNVRFDETHAESNAVQNVNGPRSEDSRAEDRMEAEHDSPQSEDFMYTAPVPFRRISASLQLKDLSGRLARISISHEDDYAIAMAMVYQEKSLTDGNL